MGLALFSYGYVNRVSPRAFQFGEKALFAAIALALILGAEIYGASLMVQIAVSTFVLPPYLYFYW